MEPHAIDAIIAALPEPTRRRPGSRTPEAEAILLAALRKGHLLGDAVALAGLSRCTVFVWRKEAAFSQAYDAAMVEGNLRMARRQRTKTGKG